MNTRVIHEGIAIDLVMHEKPFEIPKLGWAHPARVMSSTRRDELQKLVGLNLWGEKVTAVESFAIENQNGKMINLVMREKKW